MVSLFLQFAFASPNFETSAENIKKVLSDFVAADTSNPPGNEGRAVSIAAQRLKAAGIKFEITEFAPGRQNIVARLPSLGKSKALLLLAHLDVVGTQGQEWSSPPHKLIEKDGFLYGRGVADDLGMAATALEAFLLVKEQKVVLKRDLILALTGDEESSGTGLQYILKKNPKSVEAGLALNEGGGIILNEEGRPTLLAYQSAEKTYQDFEVRAQGPTGHSSIPVKENAIYRLSKGLNRLSEYQFPARALPAVRDYFRQKAQFEKEPMKHAMLAISNSKGSIPSSALTILEKDPLLSANLRTTCVATILSGGTRVNALPAEASAQINCRILPDETPADVEKNLQRVLGDPLLKLYPIGDSTYSEASPITGEGPLAFEKVSRELFPNIVSVPTLSRWATDSRHLRKAGTPTYGISPIAMSEKDSMRAHGIDERIPSKSLRSGIEFFYRLILELAEER